MPALMAGHSSCEYSALVCAGVINFADAAFSSAEMRGTHAGSGSGRYYSMSAIIGLMMPLLLKACEESAEGQVVSPVNFNSPDRWLSPGIKEAENARGRSFRKVAGANVRCRCR